MLKFNTGICMQKYFCWIKLLFITFRPMWELFFHFVYLYVICTHMFIEINKCDRNKSNYWKSRCEFLTTMIGLHGLSISDKNVLIILPLYSFLGYFSFLTTISNHLVSITMQTQRSLIIYSLYSDFSATKLLHS